MNDAQALDLRQLRRRFDTAATSFDGADFVHRITREGLLARLQPVVVDAAVVLDLGAATGAAYRQLGTRFRSARIISLDVSRNMLLVARQKRGSLARFFSRSDALLQADACQLPFRDQSIDFVFSNLLLPFVANPEAVFIEVARVLQKGGVFAFATLGPDSLLELRRAWHGVDEYAHVNRFLDMHDVGDALLQCGLRDPVLDVDRLEVRYDNSDKLFADLTNVGARNALRQRKPSLTGKRRFRAMTTALCENRADGAIRLDLELVYGHCWGGGARMDAANYRIDATRIPLRRS